MLEEEYRDREREGKTEKDRKERKQRTQNEVKRERKKPGFERTVRE